MRSLIKNDLGSSQSKKRTPRPTLKLKTSESIIYETIPTMGYTIIKCTETEPNNTYILNVVDAMGVSYVIKCSKRQTILQEINIIKSLENNYIVNTFDKNGIFFIVMNYLGKDLFSLIPRLNMEKKMYITAELIRQVKDLHSNGIVHLDIKPENIMILMNEKEEILKVTIIDYEYSRFLRLDSLAHPVNFGTIGYISPEVYKKNNIGTYTDIWSLGITIYSMYTNEPLYIDLVDKNTVKTKTLECNFDFFEENLEKIPLDIRTLIRNMLKKNPHERSF